MSKPVRFDFVKAKIKRARAGKTDLQSFHIREVDGQDEETAAMWAKGKGGAASSGEEMLRLSIVAVNDQPVSQPYLQFDTWNQRARAFAMKAFNDLNGYSKDEETAFLSTAEEETPTGSPPSASVGGLPEND